MRVFQAAREQILFAGAMKRQQVRVTLLSTGCFCALIPCPGAIGVALAVTLAISINQQIHLAGKTRERCHHRAAAVFYNQLRDENRIAEIRKRIVEALARVYAAQRIEIGLGVFANEHGARAIKRRDGGGADEGDRRLPPLQR